MTTKTHKCLGCNAQIPLMRDRCLDCADEHTRLLARASRRARREQRKEKENGGDK